jgi:hypothetical protein
MVQPFYWSSAVLSELLTAFLSAGFLVSLAQLPVASLSAAEFNVHQPNYQL